MNGRQYHKINMTEEYAREIENTYDSLLGMVKKLSGKTEIGTVSESVANLVGFIIERLSSTCKSILLYTSKTFDEDYIFAHSLNVSLMSVKIGLRLEFDKKRLKDLGFLALIHAREDIKFPEGLLKSIKRDEESEEIIRLTDVYDALSHPPTYRHAMTPQETLASIIHTDKFFDRRLIKILLEELSLYPKASWVQLSTSEIGRVIEVNKELPLRPTVKVFMDGKNNYLREPRIVDLSKNSAIYVLRPLIEEEIKRISKSQ